MDTHRITQNMNMNNSSGSERHLASGATLVNRYVIQEVIGVGGMGAVYRARDMHFPNAVKLVAVKEMISMVRDPVVRQAIVKNFEREANILATLNHPSISRIFDYFTHEDRSYLVLEYIQGKDLETLLTETSAFPPEDLIIGWAIELCDVLAFLHGHTPEPIIFRDMKPSNVMVNQFNHIVLIDFGIAKVFSLGQKGTMIGTEGYSPPEQYRGDATPQADLYALGATLHHLLTRKDPRLETPFTFAERPIRQTNPAVSVELESVVSCALQYNPGDRFQSAQAMKEALVAAARKTGALSRITARKDAAGSGGSSAAGIKPLWTFECEDEVRGSITYENEVLYVGAYDNNLYALRASNGEFIWKYPTEGGIVSKPSVVNNVIYFGSEDGRLHAISTRSGKVVWTYITDGPVRSSPKIAEGHIFLGSDDHFLHAINLVSMRRAWRVEASGAVRSTPCIANDQVYFGCESGEVFGVDFRGETRWRFKAKRAVTSSLLFWQGAVFFTSVDGQVYSLDARTGWNIWRFRMAKGSISSPANANNLIFVGSADTNIYCIESSNAREVWRFQADHQVSSSPVVYKDSLYCASASGTIYCLEFKTGRLRWKFASGEPITGTPVVQNDVVYVGSTDHRIYALPA